jgi:nitrite reductase (NADH) small subunit
MNSNTFVSTNSDKSQQEHWQTICHQDDLVNHSGVCALLANEQQVAIFKINDKEVYTISNWDPAGNANVLYRGIIGDNNGEFFVASPLYKQRFLLNSGKCLDDESLAVNNYNTRIHEEQVQVLVA